MYTHLIIQESIVGLMGLVLANVSLINILQELPTMGWTEWEGVGRSGTKVAVKQSTPNPLSHQSDSVHRSSNVFPNQTQDHPLRLTHPVHHIEDSYSTILPNRNMTASMSAMSHQSQNVSHDSHHNSEHVTHDRRPDGLKAGRTLDRSRDGRIISGADREQVPMSHVEFLLKNKD